MALSFKRGLKPPSGGGNYTEAPFSGVIRVDKIVDKVSEDPDKNSAQLMIMEYTITEVDEGLDAEDETIVHPGMRPGCSRSHVYNLSKEMQQSEAVALLAALIGSDFETLCSIKGRDIAKEAGVKVSKQRAELDGPDFVAQWACGEDQPFAGTELHLETFKKPLKRDPSKLFTKATFEPLDEDED